MLHAAVPLLLAVLSMWFSHIALSLPGKWAKSTLGNSHSVLLNGLRLLQRSVPNSSLTPSWTIHFTLRGLLWGQWSSNMIQAVCKHLTNGLMMINSTPSNTLATALCSAH
jgi:hypothetical protein